MKEKFLATVTGNRCHGAIYSLRMPCISQILEADKSVLVSPPCYLYPIYPKAPSTLDYS